MGRQIRETINGKEVKMKMNTKTLLVGIAVLLAVFGATAGSVSAVKTDEWNMIVAAGHAAGTPSVYTATAVYNYNFVTPATTDDLLLIDLRPPAQYAQGHIPGAVNIQFTALADAATATQIAALLAAHVAAGKKNEMLFYADQQTEGEIATVIYEMLGYNTRALTWGLASYSKNNVAIQERFVPCTAFDPVTGEGTTPAGCSENNYTVEKTYNPRVGGQGWPTVDNVPAGTPAFDTIRTAAQLWLNGLTTRSDYRMTMRDLHHLLDDNNDGVLYGTGDDLTNDPFVVSNRENPTNPLCSNCYQAGHIPGAIPVVRPQEVFMINQTDFMPQNKLIAHHCWTGHTQNLLIATAGMLGYDIRSLDNGITAWYAGGLPVVARWSTGNYPGNYPLEANADVSIMPTTLNLKSKGDYVTAKIRLPAGYDNTIINTGTIKLGAVSAVSASADVDSVTAKFSRAAVIATLSPGSNTLTVTGSGTIAGGTLKFVGSDTITAL